MDGESRLLVSALLAVAVLVLLIVRFKISSFIALVISSLLMGAISGMKLPETAKAFQDGMGAVLGSVAAIIGLGTILGKMLAQSGGAEVIARTIISQASPARLPWAMLLIALIIGMPVFFAVGLVLLAPILYALLRQHRSGMILLGVPLVAGLSAMHGLVPPHPGPMAAIQFIGADTGKTIFYSLIACVPAAILAGPVFGSWIAKRVVPAESIDGVAANSSTAPHPGFLITIWTILLPILLMLIATLADLTLPTESLLREVANFVGHPVVALLVGVLFSYFSFGSALGVTREKILAFSEECLGPVAMMLLIVGAGGGFSRVLIESGIGKAISGMASHWNIAPLPMGFVAACLIRVATGSATVAITTAAALVKPVVDSHPGTNLELLVVAMGAGSLILSHVNDGGFWFVKEYLKLSVPETLKTWTVVETIVSLVAFGAVLLLDAVL